MKSYLLTCILLVAIVANGYCAPTATKDVIFKPTFLTGFDSLTAGTGFVSSVNGHYVLVTAHHLFGPAAGLQSDLSPEQAKEFVAALAASSMDRASNIVTSAHMLLLTSAKAFTNTDCGKDVAAFVLEGYQGASLPLATVAPKKGDAIFLYARPRGEESLRIISGRISRTADDVIEYFYDDGKFNFAGTSGAPILNENGEVVGINLGGGELKGREFGFANPTTSFAAMIGAAIKAELAR